MKILLVSPLPPPAGGIATWTEIYCKYCKDVGHGVTVVNTALRSARTDNRKNIIQECMRTFSILSSVCKCLRKEDFGIVHINSSCSPLGIIRDTACLLLTGQRKTVLHCHCNVEDQVGNSRLARRMLSVAAKRAKAVLVLNEKSRAFLSALGCDRAQIVPNFIEREAIAEGHVICNNIQKVIYVGHVRKTKGIFEILQAAVQLPDINFQVVGPACEDLSSVEMPPNVHMLGLKTKTEVMKLLRDADVFLFPSYSEGFSVALLEAMAAGLPAIATDVGANADMLEDQGGILIPAGDAKAIVDALEKLQPQALRASMSAWSQKKVREFYTVDRVMTQLLDIMRECAT